MRRKRKPSSSRDKSIRKRKNDISIRQGSSSSRKRAQKRKRHMQKVYRRRRIFLSLVLVFILFWLSKFIINKLNSYDSYTYPKFREEVRESLGEEVFVGPTNERSLTTAEKLADLDLLYKTISRNYSISASNRDDFYEFIDSYEDQKKKVLKTKTDQEYFDILKSYTELLKNSRTNIVDKKSYDDLLDYYKNEKDSNISQVIQNPQSVNRYKRMLADESFGEKTVFSLRNHVLVISMKNFNLADLVKDIKEFNKILKENSGITKILIDLSDNQSLDYIYWQKFLACLSHKDYQNSYIVFYRGNLLKKTLEDIKSKNDGFETTYIQNQASKYPEKLEDISPDDYMYYDELKLDIKVKSDAKSFGLYLILNDNSSNEAINFAKALKVSAEAILIKNSLQTQASANDKIKSHPVDYFVLEHSGLIVSIDDSYSLTKDESYLNYNQFINTDNPVEAVLSSL